MINSEMNVWAPRLLAQKPIEGKSVKMYEHATDFVSLDEVLKNSSENDRNSLLASYGRIYFELMLKAST